MILRTTWNLLDVCARFSSSAELEDIRVTTDPDELLDIWDFLSPTTQEEISALAAREFQDSRP